MSLDRAFSLIYMGMIHAMPFVKKMYDEDDKREPMEKANEIYSDFAKHLKAIEANVPNLLNSLADVPPKPETWRDRPPML